jgi:hypothetical protein
MHNSQKERLAPRLHRLAATLPLVRVRRALMLGVTSTAVLFAAPQAAMAEPGWSSVGAGCVPTGQTSATHVNFNSAGRTSFRDPNVGEIILTCPITHPLQIGGDAAALTVAYRDPDGVGTTSRVVVALRRMNQQTGAVDTIASFDSNTSNATGFAVDGTVIGRCFSNSIDQNTFYYYVQINMTRNTSPAGVEIAAVAINPVIC